MKKFFLVVVSIAVFKLATSSQFGRPTTQQKHTNVFNNKSQIPSLNVNRNHSEAKGRNQSTAHWKASKKDVKQPIKNSLINTNSKIKPEFNASPELETETKYDARIMARASSASDEIVPSGVNNSITVDMASTEDITNTVDDTSTVENTNTVDNTSNANDCTCAGKECGYYRTPEMKCEDFYECTVDGSYLDKSCPKGLMFNSVTSMCDLISNVNCKSQCECGYHPDPLSCNTYKFCDRNHVETILTCSEPLKFDSNLLVCNWEDKTECPIDLSHTIDSLNTTIECKSNDPGIFENIFDCKQYFLCTLGELKLFQCASNLVYRPDVQYCGTIERISAY